MKNADVTRMIAEMQQAFANMAGVQPMTGYSKTTISLKKLMPKYQFSRDWYVADYDWVHQGEVLEWCVEHFGPHPQHPDAWSRWQNKYSEKIHFRDSKDYHWFMLRWGV
jgi:hypothetical protein